MSLKLHCMKPQKYTKTYYCLQVTKTVKKFLLNLRAAQNRVQNYTKNNTIIKT